MTRVVVVILPGRFLEKEEWMARATSRVSRVLMTGPLTPFADAYRAELREPGLYGAVDGVRASAGRAPQQLARGAGVDGRRLERRAR